MALPVARTRDEAHLYMDLRPCATCGDTRVDWESTLSRVDGEVARRYAGVCPGCGEARSFVFGLPDRALVPAEHEVVLFGGAEPSRLLDAGEWLWVADLCARAASGVTPGGPAAGEGTNSLAIAVAAMNEVLKFIPEGAEEVPASAFWSDRGHGVRAASPGRFGRRRLLAVRDSYRETLDRAGS